VWAFAETPSIRVFGRAGLLHLQGILQTHMKRNSDADFVATSRYSNHILLIFKYARDSTKSFSVEIGVHWLTA
jgi:hypothetical protein